MWALVQKNGELTAATTMYSPFNHRTFFQPKLTVNTPGDAHEQEADRVADQVMRMKDGDAPVVQRTSLGTGSGIMRKCDACEKEEEKKLHRKESGSGDAGGKAAPAVVSNVLSSGDGQPMDLGTRQFMESRFGQDFSSGRIYNDSRAAESAAAIQARAYTSGRDIVFGAGEYRPGSEEGRRLLAHELVHVGQQGGAMIQRDTSQQKLRAEIDLIENQIMRPHSDLSPVELEKLLEWRNYYADKLAKTSSYSGIRGTFASLVSIPYSESLNQQNTSFVQRPPGLPLSNGYLLHPIPITADNQRMLSSITEGEIVTISSSIRHRFPSSVITTPIAGSSAATIININRQLLQYGFAATGLDSIGLIGFPRAGSGIGVQKIASFFENGLMSPLESFGHTSVFVRQGGRITIVRGFQPTSWQTLSNISEIFSKRPVPSSITNDLASFTRTTAQTVEWPVTAGSAEKMAMHLSTLQPTPAAGATHWVAHPTAQNASATNCVKWSTTTVESQLGGRIGTVGADGLVDPISQPAYEGQGLQGRFMQATADGAETIAPLPGATADSAKGSMPRIYRILKWGGRAFVVVGILVAIGESVTAPEGQRARTAAREGGGFVGGLALGATAGLLCGPGALACSIVLGIGFGIAGHLLGRAVGEAIYDATK